MKDTTAPTGDLTEREVHEAADYWYDLGVDSPTPGLIKIRLKRGSNSTIAKYLSTWVSKPKIDLGPMPPPLGERGMRVLEAFYAWTAAATHEKTTALIQLATERAESAERTLALVTSAADESARALDHSETRAETHLHRAQTLAGKLRACDAECRELRRRLASDKPVKRHKAKPTKPNSQSDGGGDA